MEQVNKQNVGGQKKTSIADKIGDVVEKVGSAISKTAPGIGKKIHDVGDSIEKSHKNPKHPNDGTV
jgi:hypothetical protein